MSKAYSSHTEKIDVEYVAHLARIKLNEEERERFQAQLEEILGYVDQLKTLNVEGVDPMAHPFPIQNVFREDKTCPSLDHEVAMKNAPQKRNGHFMVPKIVE
ncbi:MAG: Asp-tRNA(Asn)/Glu-tRNA(Gln) amidotransferase subunit GatC [Kiritimatiellae bacterium]|nr:Asp-tRNA(Asn)/Glu-tRNA(Gln) amidotransferase subunit GatC [Kiritimatiellia bacterium]